MFERRQGREDIHWLGEKTYRPYNRLDRLKVKPWYADVIFIEAAQHVKEQIYETITESSPRRFNARAFVFC